MDYTSKHLYIPVSFGVFIACFIVAAYAYFFMFAQNYDDWKFVRAEIITNCMTSPKNILTVCERYADWVLSNVHASYLRNCYNRYEKRQSAYYPSMVVCTAIYKVSFNFWAMPQPNYCISGNVC